MSYRDLVQLCKKFGSINIPNLDNYSQPAFELILLKNKNLSSFASLKDNKIIKIFIFYLKTGNDTFIICINKDNIEIEYNREIIIIGYDILNEENDNVCHTLKYGRYNLNREYDDLLDVYYDLESKYKSVS